MRERGEQQRYPCASSLVVQLIVRCSFVDLSRNGSAWPGNRFIGYREAILGIEASRSRRSQVHQHVLYSDTKSTINPHTDSPSKKRTMHLLYILQGCYYLCCCCWFCKNCAMSAGLILCCWPCPPPPCIPLCIPPPPCCCIPPPCNPPPPCIPPPCCCCCC